MRAVPLLLLLAACADVSDHVDAVRAGFPEHAAVALGDTATPFLDTPGGFVAGGVALPVDATGAITMADASGFTVQIRETRLAGAGTADGGHVRYARDDGSVFWSARGAVVEEWLYLEHPQPGVIAEYATTGGRLEPRGDTVAILDGGGVARIVVTAPFAVGASGARIGLRLGVRDHVITLAVDDAAAGEASILVDPSWTSIGILATARRLHTATLLGNGKVLMAGGYGANGAIATCELYDPASGKLTPAASLQTARYGHAAVLLDNGNVLVSGGRGTVGTHLRSGNRSVHQRRHAEFCTLQAHGDIAARRACHHDRRRAIVV